MTSLLSARGSGGFRHHSGLVALAVLFVTMAQPVIAQSYQERSQSRKHLQQRWAEPQPSPSSSSPSSLPDWAEPSQSQGESFSGTGVNGKATTNAPPPPPPPPQVPVDGGLALLAAAGAGYAVRKLNEDDEGEDDLP